MHGAQIDQRVGPAEPGLVQPGPSGLRALPATLRETVSSGALDTWMVPGLMALALVIGGVLSAARLNLLLDWSERYDGAGHHLVLGCAAEGLSGGDGWVCDGALVPDGSTVDVRSDLVASRGAAASDRPHVGQRLDVFYDADELAVVHPTAHRLNELARLYLSLLPRLLLAGGAAIWLAGWFLTRDLDRADLVARDNVRLPGRFGWQGRGTRWLVVAGLAVVANHLITTWVIGSLGTF